ncbi:Sec20 [Teratosphaeria destructans]|uniref:Sec20 n=1 Tax=Teratosphaeria destructans TaxID=418781 RepID=A0A9W7SIH2_9PEZI|nr:Sec20 [Teratosphaeria destructans]
MSTLHQLSHHLAQLHDSLKATNALITRLAKLTFQPGSEPDNSGTTVRLELSQDIHDTLKQLEEELELLKQEVEDATVAAAPQKRRESEKQREGARLSAQVLRLEEDLKHSRGHFRRAQLTAKRNSEAAKQKERELVFQSLQTIPDNPTAEGTNGTQDLFAGRSKRQQQQKHLSKDELEVQASTDVTAALRRTHNLLSTELSRSRFAQETFDQSTAALEQLGETYTDLGTIIDKSKDLLGTLLRSQKSDTWYLETAFYILLALFAWLVFRRLLFGPFIKLPLFFYNCAIFLLNWTIFKPLYLFLTLTGIVTTRTVEATPSVSRAPLIVHNSATSGPTLLPMADRLGMRKQGPGVPAGMGGAGAKRDKTGHFQDMNMEQIAQRHERSEGEASGTAKQDEEEGVVRRGDGTILEERGDVPKNPKKKAFEADVEDAKQEVKEEGKARVKRDEL